MKYIYEHGDVSLPEIPLCFRTSSILKGQTTDIVQVTIEINTDPPPMDLSGESKSMKLQGTMSMDELADAVQAMAYDFTLSPELMG